MTKAQLQSELYSAKLELEHVIKQLQTRVNFNDINRIEEESKDDDSGMEMAKKCGSFQALTHMANTDMDIAIKNLTRVVNNIKQIK